MYPPPPPCAWGGRIADSTRMNLPVRLHELVMREARVVEAGTVGLGRQLCAC